MNKIIYDYKYAISVSHRSQEMVTVTNFTIRPIAPWQSCYCMRAGGSFSLFIATSSHFLINLENFELV